MRIRKARLTDAKALAKLVYSLSHYYLQRDTDQLPDWFLKPLTEKSFNARLMSDNYTTLLCEDDGKMVGYVSIRGGNYLHHLFVHEEYQGKGLGRQLWNTIRGLCPSEEYLLRSSMHAVPVFEKFGFEESGDVSEKEGIQFQPMSLSVDIEALDPESVAPEA
jgi:GNAT superfamily N-acetyltransferase